MISVTKVAPVVVLAVFVTMILIFSIKHCDPNMNNITLFRNKNVVSASLEREMEDVVRAITKSKLDCKLNTISLYSDEHEARTGTLTCKNDSWFVRQGVEIFEGFDGDKIWNFTGPLMIVSFEEEYCKAE